jgi:cell division transport system ATP-binding protein
LASSIQRVADFGLDVQDAGNALSPTTSMEGGQGHLVRFQRVASGARGAMAGLAPLSFLLGRGARAAFVGPPGSGKSLALRLIAMAAPPPAGRLELFGTDVSAIRSSRRALVRRRLGLMLPDFPLLDALSVIDNIALAAQAVGRDEAEFFPRGLELLNWVGLSSRAGEAAGRLGLEGRWRLSLARALTNSPELLLADEPGAGLADGPREALLKLIDQVHGAGIAVIMAMTDEAKAARLGPTVRLSRWAAGPVFLAGAA